MQLLKHPSDTNCISNLTCGTCSPAAPAGVSNFWSLSLCWLQLLLQFWLLLCLLELLCDRSCSLLWEHLCKLSPAMVWDCRLAAVYFTMVFCWSYDDVLLQTSLYTFLLLLSFIQNWSNSCCFLKFSCKLDKTPCASVSFQDVSTFTGQQESVHVELASSASILNPLESLCLQGAVWSAFGEYSSPVWRKLSSSVCQYQLPYYLWQLTDVMFYWWGSGWSN